MNFLINNKIALFIFDNTIIACFLFITISCIDKSIAQVNTINSSDNLKKTVVRLNIINPGLSVEQQISFSNTIVADISLALLTIFDSSQYKYYFYFYPRVRGEYRHYYNFSRRLREGKSINHFSGSYIGIAYQHLFGDKKRPTFDQAGVMWGTQYVSIRRFHIGFNIGFGYSIYADPRIAQGFSVIGDLKIGYTF